MKHPYQRQRAMSYILFCERRCSEDVKALLRVKALP